MLKKEIIEKYKPILNKLILDNYTLFAKRDFGNVIQYIKNHYAYIISSEVIDAIVGSPSNAYLYVAGIVDNYVEWRNYVKSKNFDGIMNSAFSSNLDLCGYENTVNAFRLLDGTGMINGQIISSDVPIYNGFTRKGNNPREMVKSICSRIGHCYYILEVILKENGYRLSEIPDVYEAYAKLQLKAIREQEGGMSK